MGPGGCLGLRGGGLSYPELGQGDVASSGRGVCWKGMFGSMTQKYSCFPAQKPLCLLQERARGSELAGSSTQECFPLLFVAGN